MSKKPYFITVIARNEAIRSITHINWIASFLAMTERDFWDNLQLACEVFIQFNIDFDFIEVNGMDQINDE